MAQTEANKPTKPHFSWAQRLYLPAIFRGLALTFKHMFKRKFTVQYPEQRKSMPATARWGHRLNKDAEGRVKCVACEMCMTACPAKCIHIVGGPAPWEDREKYPVIFEINMLRCIFCGYCVEACPEDAIDMTNRFNFTNYTRQSFLWDKTKLLQMYDETREEPTLGQVIRGEVHITGAPDTPQPEVLQTDQGSHFSSQKE